MRQLLQDGHGRWTSFISHHVNMQFAIVQVGKLPWCARTTMFHPRSISIVVSSKLQGIELRYLALVPRPESSYWHGASAWTWECAWVRLLVSDFLQGRLFLVVHAVMLQDYQTHWPLSCFETLQLCAWSEWVSSMTVSFDLYTVDVLRFILATCSSPFIEADAVLRRIFCPVVTPRTCRLPAKKINSVEQCGAIPMETCGSWRMLYDISQSHCLYEILILELPLASVWLTYLWMLAVGQTWQSQAIPWKTVKESWERTWPTMFLFLLTIDGACTQVEPKLVK